MSRAVDEHRGSAPESVGCAVVTVSDSKTLETDESGRILEEALTGAGHSVHAREIIPDEPDRIRETLRAILENEAVQAILLTGGTGIAPRDGTVEVVDSLLTKRLEGFGELFRALSYEEIGPAAMLSRAVAGVAGKTLIFALPGSPNAVRLAVEKLILPEIGHAVGLLTRNS